ncbi:hypothetical protein BD779DRAFT_1033668 [Infundibulicybe gibba]|nr:hypothetical protein BD779DRAFT_1033668 [Infundibulicybe gibba]
MMNLPPEIIEKIFLELCLSETISTPHRRDPRLLVSWVCSQWRAIALATPSLWANIRIPIDSPSSHDYIRTWISRSAQSALSVVFYGPAHSATPSTEIFDLIVPQAIRRCASLKLCINEPTLKRLFTLPPGSLRALRSISIRPIPSRHKIYSIPYITAFQQCPWLHRVTFTFEADNLDLAYLNLPWHQLTYLDVSSCSLLEYECLDVLRQCIALQECNISAFTTPLRDLERIETLSISPVVLPSLHTLCLDLSRPSFRTSLSPPCRMLPMFQYLLSGTISHLTLGGLPWI